MAVARRLDSYLPSQWQERVKAGERRSFEDWLRVVLDRSSGEYNWDRNNVWHAHDTKRLVERWVAAVGEDRFTLIVSDESDRELLPRTFEDLLGLPHGTLRPDPSRSNRGLTWAETELVRAVNGVAADRGWAGPSVADSSSTASCTTWRPGRPPTDPRTLRSRRGPSSPSGR